jgi:RsiW-degrading membrane proteinase PrsW (M82 family)
LTSFQLLAEPAVWRAVVLSLLPGLFWLTYLRSLSRRGHLPRWLWLWALLLGWVSAVLTLWLSRMLHVEQLTHFPVFPRLVYFVLGVGLVEEGAKALCAVLGLSLPGWARHPLTALQLSGAVALGFATTENVIYVLRYGETVLLGRFIFSTLGHVLFCSVWGFAMGMRDDSAGRPRHRWGWLLQSLLWASLAHGLYDWFLDTDRMGLAVLTLAVLWFGFRQATLEAFLRQEYERVLPYPSVECPHCSVLTRAEGLYCSFCGAQRSLSSRGEVADGVTTDQGV